MVRELPQAVMDGLRAGALVTALPCLSLLSLDTLQWFKFKAGSLHPWLQQSVSIGRLIAKRTSMQVFATVILSGWGRRSRATRHQIAEARSLTDSFSVGRDGFSVPGAGAPRGTSGQPRGKCYSKE